MKFKMKKIGNFLHHGNQENLKMKKNKCSLNSIGIQRNKKGVGLIATVLLVLMVLTTVSYALYSFATTSGKINARISDASLTELILAREQIAEFYIRESGKNAFIKTYSNFIKNGEYIENPKTNFNYFEFGELNSRLNEKFSEEFKKNFLEEFNKYEFEEDYLKLLKEKIGNSKISYNNNEVKIEIDGWETEEKSESLIIYYNPKIIVELNSNDFGVDSFEDLKKAKDVCVKATDKGKCYFENLFYFNSVELKDSDSGINYIHLSSKKQFLIDSEFRKIEFDFIGV